MAIKQQFKSKTIWFNILFAALIAGLQAAGINIAGSEVAGGAALLNVILRQFTNKPINEK